MATLSQVTKWLMLVSGVLTASMFYGLFAPQAALESMFGASFDGALESLVVRSWSALVGLMGLVLIYGFCVPAVRRYSLCVAALSKLIFIALIALWGRDYLSTLAAAITMDLIVVVVALFYLVFCRSEGEGSLRS